MGEPIILTVYQARDGTRTTTVASWPRETMFDESIFGQSDPAQLAVSGDIVTVTVSNGQAVYQLLKGATDDPRLSIPARLVSSRLSVATATRATGDGEAGERGQP